MLKLRLKYPGVPPVTITTRMFGSPANSCRFSVSASPISASKYMRFALPKVITAIPSVTLVDKTSAFIEGSLRFNVFRRIGPLRRAKDMESCSHLSCFFELDLLITAKKELFCAAPFDDFLSLRRDQPSPLGSLSRSPHDGNNR